MPLLHYARPALELTRGTNGLNPQAFLDEVESQLHMRFGPHDETQGFILQLVLLPALAVACDELRITRCHRRLQGTRGGVPNVRAETLQRPPERHRQLPTGTVEEWTQRYVDSGSGELSTVSGACHVVDQLTQHFEGEALCVRVAVRIGMTPACLRAGESLNVTHAWRADCLNAELPPPDQLWADIRHRNYEAPLRALRLARAITEELCAAAPMLRGELPPAAFEAAAACAETCAIRGAIIRELLPA